MRKNAVGHDERGLAFGLIDHVRAARQPGDKRIRFTGSINYANHLFIRSEPFHRLVQADKRRLSNRFEHQRRVHEETEHQNAGVGSDKNRIGNGARCAIKPAGQKFGNRCDPASQVAR